MLKTVLVCLMAGWAAGSLAAESPRALFLQAEQALNQGHAETIRDSLTALEGYPLHSYLWFEWLNQTPGTETEIPAYLQRYGQTRHAASLRRKWLGYLARQESWAEYLKAYQDTSEVETQCDYGWALARLGRDKEAWAVAARLWDSGESRPAACDRLFTAWRASSAFSQALIWKRLALALDKNQLGLARSLQALLPESARNLAEFWFTVHAQPALVTECSLWRREEPVHGRIFAHGIDRLAADDPLRAESLWSLRRGEFAIPKEDATRIERKLALALATQRYPQATAYLSVLEDEAGDSQIRTWRVRAALWRQDWPGVLAALARLDSQEQRQPIWRYWRARALEAVGETARARELYAEVAGEREFYGFAAADHLQRPYPLAFAAAPVAEAELQALAESEPFRAVREFRELNRPGEAQKEWLHVIQRLPEASLGLAAHLAQRWGWDRLAILTLAKSGHHEDLNLRFPLAYAGPVENQARERGLDPALVYSLIRRESAFDAYAKSGVGALGLMQLMPTTGEQVARDLREAWSSERSLLEPDTNVRYGTAYFRGLLERFGQHVALAAAAYNAGPNRVERWLPSLKSLPADIWIETIPFTETRQYVSAVLSYAVIYRARLGGEGGRLTGFLADIAPGPKIQSKPDRPVAVSFCQ